MDSKELYHRTRRRASKLGLPFNLTPGFIDQMTIPIICPVLGIPLKLDRSTEQTDDSISIDRIDSSKGYTQDNVIFVSWRANRHKSNASLKELKMLYEFYSSIDTLE